MKNLCIASTNSNKIRELKDILGRIFQLCSLQDFGNIEEAQEPFGSFTKNAHYKAKYYAQFTKMMTLSEDTGLRIRSLNGFPGPYSKRFIESSGGIGKAFEQLEAMLSLKEKFFGKRHHEWRNTILGEGNGRVWFRSYFCTRWLRSDHRRTGCIRQDGYRSPRKSHTGFAKKLLSENTAMKDILT